MGHVVDEPVDVTVVVEVEVTVGAVTDISVVVVRVSVAGGRVVGIEVVVVTVSVLVTVLVQMLLVVDIGGAMSSRRGQTRDVGKNRAWYIMSDHDNGIQTL